MKLVLVTVVQQYENDVLQLFKKAKIKNFSESSIEGYKQAESLHLASNWFSAGKNGVKSSMFFSFTTVEKIDVLFDLIKEFNKNLESQNPIKAVVVPIEKFI